MKKQTAGRDAFGEFAPKFAQLNDDVLFGEVWLREDKLSLRDRSVITVTALISKGIFDNSLKYHITNAKNRWRKINYKECVYKERCEYIILMYIFYFLYYISLNFIYRYTKINLEFGPPGLFI